MSEHKLPSAWTFFKVFTALIVLTVFTIYSATQWNLGSLNIVLALVIATSKASLVILYFMNLKNSTRLTQTWAAIGLFFLLILLIFGMTDFFSRWMPVEGW